jgi:ethanolamine utilization protein EutJ
MDFSEINKYLDSFYKVLYSKDTKITYEGRLKVGIDLGTANIVFSVVDQNGVPVTGAIYPAMVVRDGLVVDYVGAVEIVRELKCRIKKGIGREIKYASTAIPPGTVGGNLRAIANVIESAGIEVVNIIDEPTAAATVLGVTDGAVVDVGGGTTGISILKKGEVIYTADEPTGGTHMSLVIAGNYKISYEKAEKIKKDPLKEKEILPIIRPVIEKMAYIVKKHIEGYEVSKVYVVGGACSFSEFENIFTKQLGIQTYKPKWPLLVTPLGIALNCDKRGE